jgi:hypothetical protein
MMRLKTNQVLTMLASLRSDDDRSRGDERRCSRRVPMYKRLTIIFRPHRPDCSTTVVLARDMSAGGICIVHDEALSPGTPFIAQFPSRGGEPRSVLYSVAHCSQLPGKMHCIGARLVHIFGDIQPQDWRAMAAAARP